MPVYLKQIAFRLLLVLLGGRSCSAGSLLAEVFAGILKGRWDTIIPLVADFRRLTAAQLYPKRARRLARNAGAQCGVVHLRW